MNPKLLVPYDFGPTSRAALAWAAELARGLHGSITLLHVLVAIPTAGPNIVTSSSYPSEEDQERVRADLRAVAAEAGVTADVEVVVSMSVGVAITTHAEAIKCDLVVMGTHGRAGIRRAVLGSAADHVVRRAPCPVLTVRETSHVPRHESPEDQARDAGLPGGGKGRTDEVSRHGIFPYSVQPHPPSAEPELRTPASLTPNAPYEESGRSAVSEYGGGYVGGDDTEETPPQPRPSPQRKV